MNAYFFKMSKEDKDNILDQHKELYNGFATNNVSSNMQPLYTQDFANDKGGITVSNKGDVMTYRNMNINENVNEIESEDDEVYVSLGERLDMIGDGPYDLPNGTVDVDDSENNLTILISPESDEDYGDWESHDDEEWEEDIFGDEFEDEEKGEISFNIQESLDMFNRFKKYN